MKKKPSVIIDKIFKVIVSVLMILYAVSLMIPLVWMLYSSLKPYDEYLLYTFQLPKTVSFSNYADVLRKLTYEVTKTGVGTIRYGIGSMLIYSFVWSCSTNLLSTFVLATTSYVISRYRFPGKNFLYSLGIVLMITPIIGTGPASLRLHKIIGMYDNMFLKIVIESLTGHFYGFSFILLYGAWKGISWHYAEAAFIDGATNLRVYVNVMFPLIVPTCTVIFILGFLTSWNDYMTFINWLPSYPSLAVGMYMFQYRSSQYNAGMPVILAGFTFAALPTAIMYLVSQKVIMAKLNVGGLKG